MNSVTLWRTIDAPPTVVRESMNELDQFMRASGFDEVHVDGETVRVANEMGIATIELTLELVDRPDADLAYEQRKGIFEEMRTAYTVTSDPNGVKWSQRRSSRLTLRSSEMYLTQRSSNANGERNSRLRSIGLKGSVQISWFHAKANDLSHSLAVSASALLKQFEKLVVLRFTSRKTRSTLFRFP